MNTLAIAAAAAALWSGSGNMKANAQCFEFPQLLSISSTRMALTQPEKIKLLPASAWKLQPAAAPNQEVVWTSLMTDAAGVAYSEIRLRPLAGQSNPDVLLKTNQVSCVRQLRSALKSEGIKPVAVTCPNCEAQRYQAPDFEATLYSGLKGAFPFLLVVHPKVAGSTAPPSVSRQP